MSSVNASAPLAISTISRDDVTDALSAGWRDFRAALPYSVFFGAIYALGGAVIATLLFATPAELAVYPLAAGFALIAPFVAAGTYQISRRLERGEALSFLAILSLKNGSQELGWMALVTTFALLIWLDVALFIYLIFFGTHVLSLGALITAIATTPAGLAFFIVGNLAGGCIAFVLFALTAVSCPMLIDRDVDAITAMITSVRAVRRNARPMFAWAILISFLLAAATIAYFVGLVVVLPLLGHASWHLYRKLVVSSDVVPQPLAAPAASRSVQQAA